MNLRRFASALLMTLVFGAHAQAQPLAGAALANALRQGGYVLLMRHAHAPAMPPDKAAANADNVKDERQLDDEGRNTARAMGDAFKTLGIPVGAVLSSPTYRALETVRFAGFGTAETHPELGDYGQSMQAVGAQVGAWIKMQVAVVPRAGRNTILITHQPNIAAAYSEEAATLGDGEALVFRPDGKGGAALVARVKIGEWPQLAAH